MAAGVAVLLLAGLSVLQVLVAAGRPYGRLVWGGGHEVLPVRLQIGSACSVLVYAAVGAVLLWRAGVVGDAPPGAVVVTTWALAGYFALGVLVNGISRSRAERQVMTPVCLVLLVCTVVVGLSD